MKHSPSNDDLDEHELLSSRLTVLFLRMKMRPLSAHHLELSEPCLDLILQNFPS